jgi:hypothetical protein
MNLCAIFFLSTHTHTHSLTHIQLHFTHPLPSLLFFRPVITTSPVFVRFDTVSSAFICFKKRLDFLALFSDSKPRNVLSNQCALLSALLQTYRLSHPIFTPYHWTPLASDIPFARTCTRTSNMPFLLHFFFGCA